MKNMLLIVFAMVLCLWSGCAILKPNFDNEYENYDDNDKLISTNADWVMSSRDYECGYNPESNFIFKATDLYIRGLKQITKIDAKESQKIKFEFSGELEKGHYKIILIDPEDNITTLFEDDKVINDEVELKKGTNLIKIVGKPAQIKSIEAKIEQIDLSKVDILSEKDSQEKKSHEEFEKARLENQKAIEKAHEDYQKALDKAQDDFEKSIQ